MDHHNVNIGQRIRHYRQLQGITLKTLAEKVGVTSSMLSQIERDLANPSLNTLRAISAVLDVQLFRIFMAAESPQPNGVVHPENRRHIIEGGVDYEMLTPDTASALSFYTMTLQPGHSTTDSMMAHKGEEAALLLEGEMTLHLDDTPIVFHAGDSIRIPPLVKHAWFNNSDKPAVLVFAITFPGL